MWMIKTKDGLELTEKELKFWDNVPSDIEIKSLGVAIERNGQKPYIINVEGFEEICCAKIGSSIGGGGKIIGWVVFGVSGEIVTEFSIRTEGVQLKSYHRDKLTLRESCLRKMIA